MSYLRNFFKFAAIAAALGLCAVIVHAAPFPNPRAVETTAPTVPAGAVRAVHSRAADNNATPPQGIPESASAVLVGLALLGAGTMARRRVNAA